MVILLPIALIFVGSWADSLTVVGGTANQIMHALGYPDVAMLLAVLVALATLGRMDSARASASWGRICCGS